MDKFDRTKKQVIKKWLHHICKNLLTMTIKSKGTQPFLKIDWDHVVLSETISQDPDSDQDTTIKVVSIGLQTKTPTCIVYKCNLKDIMKPLLGANLGWY